MLFLCVLVLIITAISLSINHRKWLKFVLCLWHFVLFSKLTILMLADGAQTYKTYNSNENLSKKYEPSSNNILTMQNVQINNYSL